MKIEFDNDELVFVGKALNSLIPSINSDLLKSISGLDYVNLLKSESVLDVNGVKMYFHNDGTVLIEFSDKFKSFVKTFTNESLIPLCSYLSKARKDLSMGVNSTIMRPILTDCYIEEAEAVELV